MAIITAMPDVNPLITGIGINEISLPRCSTPAITRIMPASTVATNTPCKPYCAIMDINIAAMAPVGPEI